MTVASDRPGCSKSASNKAAAERQPEAYPQWYVEDFYEPRTTREAVFSSMPKNYLEPHRLPGIW